MILAKRSCCFTGHRNIRLSEDVAIKQCLKKIIEEKILLGCCDFLTGMALGFDCVAAEIVLELKKKYSFIRLFCIVPCGDQDKFFSAKEKQIYHRILKQADETIILQDAYSRGCMHTRNRYLVDNSSCVIAYLTKKTGGTAYTISYANKKEKDIINVASLIEIRRNQTCLGVPIAKQNM